jgi:hypothetical protein
LTAPILESVEQSLINFRPRSQREFVALQVARRFNDLDRLAKYINAARNVPKKVFLEAARLATKRADETGGPVTTILFELLDKFGEQEGGVGGFYACVSHVEPLVWPCCTMTGLRSWTAGT